jgi:hypothetical protein
MGGGGGHPASYPTGAVGYSQGVRRPVGEGDYLHSPIQLLLVVLN